jgi:hypothetical protein
VDLKKIFSWNLKFSSEKVTSANSYTAVDKPWYALCYFGIFPKIQGDSTYLVRKVVAPPLRCRPPPNAASAKSMTATLTNCYVPLPAVASSSSSCHLFDPLARIDDNDGDTSSLLVRKTNHNDKSSSATATTTAGTNKTTRGPRTLRRLRLETSILSSSNSGGSSLVEWGHTKLLVSVRGPRPITASSMMKPHDGGSGSGNGVNLVCEVRYMPHVGINIETIALHTL